MKIRWPASENLFISLLIVCDTEKMIVAHKSIDIQVEIDCAAYENRSTSKWKLDDLQVKICWHPFVKRRMIMINVVVIENMTFRHKSISYRRKIDCAEYENSLTHKWKLAHLQVKICWHTLNKTWMIMTNVCDIKFMTNGH